MRELTLNADAVKLGTAVGALRCIGNDVEQPADGGRVMIALIPPTDAKSKAAVDHLYEDLKITGLTLVVNYRKDEPMRAFPVTREDCERRRYSLYLVEEPVEGS